MRPLGLKPRLLLITLAIFAMTGLVSFALFLAASRSLVETLGSRFAETNILLAKSRILGKIDREAALARKLADSPVVKRWMLDESDPRARELATAELESYRAAFTDGNYFVAIASSRRYYNQPAQGAPTVVTLSPERASDQWFFTSLRSVKDFALNLDYNPYIKATKVWINCAVKQGEKTIGLAGTGLDLTDLVSELTAKRQANLSIMLLDGAGNITAYSDIDILERNARSWSGGGEKVRAVDLAARPADRAALERLLQGLDRSPDEVRSARLTFAGARTLVAASYLPGIDWIILASVDVDHMLDLRSLAKIPLVFLAALILALLVFAILADRFILDPLSALSRAAGEIARGSYDLRLPIAGIGEIRELGETFAAMAGEVRRSTEGLEHRVAERTAELAEANRRMIEDLRYADIVQRSILPRDDALDLRISERFILFRPRERVGGDFYFFHDRPASFIIGLADCTGHGVSGALMTMFAEGILEPLLAADEARNPADLVDELRRRLRSGLALEARGLEGERGIDIALCEVLPSENRLRFAGAGVDLFVAGAGGVERVRSGRRSSAALRRDFDLEGRAFYLCTDGFLDQAGGPSGFGYGATAFEGLVASSSTLPWSERLGHFEEALDSWRGPLPQRDDITVVAFEAPTLERGDA